MFISMWPSLSKSISAKMQRISLPHAKLLEQLCFSGISFATIFISGLLLDSESFFVFSYAFTVLQVMLVLGFSYLGNSFFVFYSQRQKQSYVSSALLLTWVISCVLGFILSSLLLWKGFDLVAAVTASTPLLFWLSYDILRKKAFVENNNSRLLLNSFLLAITGLLSSVMLWYFSASSAGWFFISITICFAIACLAKLQLNSFSFNKRIFIAYAYKNHVFAKWTLLSAAIMWFLSSGVLLIYEPYLTKEEFSGIRLMLSFIGLANLITTVIENSLITQYAPKARRGGVSLMQMKRNLMHIGGGALVLTLFIYGVAWLSFHTVYKVYVDAFSQYQALVLLAALFAINKVFSACLKLNEKPKFIFASALLGVLVVLICYAGFIQLGVLFAFLSGVFTYVAVSFLFCLKVGGLRAL